MPTDPLSPLLTLAAVTGVVHTLAGPDHYLPFVVLARSRGWSTPRTIAITVACGVGHVLGSVVLGLAGLAVGAALFHLEAIETARGQLAAWGMIAFGLVYAVWGWRRRGWRPAHRHDAAGRESATPWILFLVFVFGPCEVLIPQVMYPAATGRPGGVLAVVAVFALATILTMLGAVLVLRRGLRRLRTAWLQRHTHELAGVTVALCGLLILVGF